MYALLIVVHLTCCIGLIVVVLLQAGRGGGLSGALGSGAVETSLGAGASDVLKKGTTVFAVVFMLTSLGIAFLTAQRSASVVKDKITPSTIAPQQVPKGTADGGLKDIIQKISEKLPGVEEAKKKQTSENQGIEVGESESSE